MVRGSREGVRLQGKVRTTPLAYRSAPCASNSSTTKYVQKYVYTYYVEIYVKIRLTSYVRIRFNVYVFIRHFPRSTYYLRRINTPYYVEKYVILQIRPSLVRTP